ncbi:MAG: phosphate signaling complex protein PhoU [Oscillospiraceae bacterium]|nr:phosphate signaling complex protein PhoU [Oscillospiraceae bacterium]
MRKLFDEQLKELNIEMIKMAGQVETAIAGAAEALIKNDITLAKQVMGGDEIVDDMEKKIEHLCLKLLLQQQPVATDLRRVSTALKMTTDLERIGDQAVDIAELTLKIGRTDNVHIPQMAKAVIRMVTDSINAYVNSDEKLANDVMAEDDRVDELFVKIRDELIEMAADSREKGKQVGEQAIDLLMVAKYLERIGDHAVNIAEWVIFSVTGVHKNAKII